MEKDEYIWNDEFKELRSKNLKDKSNKKRSK